MTTNSAIETIRNHLRDTARLLPRRLVVRTALMALMAATAGLPGTPAFAADSPVPPAVRSLDHAAMALFDAAETADWAGGARDLAQARQATDGVDRLEGAFTDAGGEPEHYIEVQNNLSADLMEADLALSVHDQRWLINAADRVASRAGELSQPFADKSKGVTPKIESLLFLDRRMRRALVWSDDDGYRNADLAFKKVWSSLKTELAGRAAGPAKALDGALARLRVESSSANLKALYTATQDLRQAVS